MPYDSVFNLNRNKSDRSNVIDQKRPCLTVQMALPEGIRFRRWNLQSFYFLYINEYK